MKRKRKSPMLDVSEVCIICGKPIAAIIRSEALCCSCRFGKNSWKDKVKPVCDCVDYMKNNIEDRLDSGFRRLRRHED